MKCKECNSILLVNAGIGIFCHGCNKLFMDDDMKNNFTEWLINRTEKDKWFEREDEGDELSSDFDF